MFEYLQLHVPAEIHDGSIEVRWCLTKEGREALTEQKIVEPWVLVIVAHEETYIPEVRQMVRLSELATYVQFRSPGVNHILAKVVWQRSKDESVQDVYLTRKKGEFLNDVLQFSRTGFLNGNGTHLSVNVPKDVFSKPPRDLRWLSWMIDAPLVDDCHVRRRRIFAYTLQPPVALVIGTAAGLALGLMYVGRAAAVATLWLLGIRGNDYSDFWNWKLDYFEQVTMSSKSCIFLPTWRGHRLESVIAFSPLVVLIVASIFTILGLHHHWSLSHILLLSIACVMGIAVMIGFVKLLLHIPQIARLVGHSLATLGRFLFVEEEPAWFEQPDVVKDMVCDENRPMTILIKKPTLRLRYLGVKSKVCAPLPYSSR